MFIDHPSMIPYDKFEGAYYLAYQNFYNCIKFQ